MQNRRIAVARNCLFGGTLLAAGLVAPDAHAQSLEFSNTSALAWTPGRSEAFNGPGAFSVESHYSYFGSGDAEAWGTPTAVGIYAYGTTDTGEPAAYASVLSHFTVTSDALATVDWALYTFGPGWLGACTLTDVTNDVVLLETYHAGGSVEIQLLAGTEYQLLSIGNYGYAELTIQPPPDGACCLVDGGCIEANAAECANAGGDYQGDATACADVECKPPPDCPADVTSDGVVDVADLVEVILDWGPCKGPCASDVNADGIVDVQDVVAVILAWGSCG